MTQAFDSVPVIRDLSLSFPAACVTAVVGASGCGKSTLLKLCNGLHRPSSGVVRVFGKPIDYARLPELRRRMGYAVQGTGLFPHLDARSNIELGARLLSWPPERRAQRVSELAALMRLDEALLERYPHQLSGGQQQRVGLCRAMMLRPEILLLDEPFAAIDPITRVDIHDQLQELIAAEPVTVVLVTHDMREAMKLASHVVVLRDGRVAHQGPVEQLRRQGPAEDPEILLRELLRGDD
ncbi:MAG: ATP-binding cassette domain-containing protein [Halieaceae bacterium]|nr:ATP-binding cassette domain-containing protein [Halieaceae bacterium]